MYGEIYTATSGMQVLQMQMDFITNNLANVDTAGFKIDEAISEERFIETPLGSVSTPCHAKAYSRYIDFSQGPVKPTGDLLDVALNGEGFFVVSTPNGDRLTRCGHFTKDAEGTLKLGGLPVQDEAEGEIVLGEGEVKIREDGSITQNGVELGRLRLVRVENPQLLEKEGSTLYKAPEGVELEAIEAGDTDLRVLQGHLERSNADAIDLMVRMISTSRAYEMHQKAIQTFDQLGSKAIQSMGRVG